MNWKVGQKVIALCNVAIYKPDNTLVSYRIKVDEIYKIESIEPGCCMKFLDVGLKNEDKNSQVSYTCEKCNKEYLFNVNEPLLCNEKWFKPLDEQESSVKKMVRKISTKFIKKKIKEDHFTKIKIKQPAKPSKIEIETRPPITFPKREKELI
jgi:hypothetical protein